MKNFFHHLLPLSAAEINQRDEIYSIILQIERDVKNRKNFKSNNFIDVIFEQKKIMKKKLF